MLKDEETASLLRRMIADDRYLLIPGEVAREHG